jgi:hypothetical protein
MTSRIAQRRGRAGVIGIAMLAVTFAGCAAGGSGASTSGPAAPGPAPSSFDPSGDPAGDEIGAAIDDCPLTDAGWAGSSDGSGITVTVRAGGPLDVTLDIFHSGSAEPVQAGGTIAAGAPGASYAIPVDRALVTRIVLRATGGSAAPVLCQVTGGD